MSCHCDDWQVPAGFRFSLAYCPRRIESIHDWHLDIHQNHIKLVLKRNRNRFPTVLDRCDMVPMFFQDTDGESLVDHIVLGEQDPKFSGQALERYPHPAKNPLASPRQDIERLNQTDPTTTGFIKVRHSIRRVSRSPSRPRWSAR